MADPRTYIKLHDGMPDHPKVDGLSDKAFRLLIGSWCWCSRHLTDGRIPAATWRKRGTPKARKELVEAGLAEVLADGDVAMHDYLEHQRSADKVREVREAKGRGGSYGNHVRWHLKEGVVNEHCPHCPTAPPDDPGSPVDEPVDNPVDRSHMRSQNRSESGRKTSPENSVREQKGISDPSEGSLDHHPADRYARRREADADLTTRIDERIIELLAELTGRTVDRTWASKIRRQILDDRHVTNPLSYITSCLRGDPQRYLPTTGDPSTRTVTEALRTARGEPT